MSLEAAQCTAMGREMHGVAGLRQVGCRPMIMAPGPALGGGPDSSAGPNPMQEHVAGGVRWGLANT